MTSSSAQMVNYLTAPNTSEQNGVAERTGRSIVEMMRSVLHHANLNSTFWKHALYTAIYIKNRAPHKALQDNTPYEVWYGTQCKYVCLHGCDACILVEKTQPKLETKLNYVFLSATQKKRTHTSSKTNYACVIVVSKW